MKRHWREYDSGGGWFVWHQKKWQAAALTFGVSPSGASHFLTDMDPTQLYGIRLSTYRDWIVSNMNDICDKIVTGDLDCNCVVDEGCHLKGIDLTHQMVRRDSRIEK